MTLATIIGEGNWQTVLLYAAAALAVIWAFVFWSRKNEQPWKEFHFVGLIANMVDGNWRIDAAKTMAFGAFVISAIGVVVCVIRGKVPSEFVGLLTIFGGIYAGVSLGNRQINTNAEVNIRKAEINQGRRSDVVIADDDNARSVEEEETMRLRRRKSDSVFK